MTRRTLEVQVNDQPVGRLSEEDDLWQFEYADAWIAAPDGFDLSPALSRAAGRHVDGGSSRPVQWYFDNLLPEEALRTVIAKEARLDSDDAFGLLSWFGAESAGSLVLRDPAAPGTGLHGLRPLSLQALNRRILNLPRTSLTREAPKRMSLAGAQHKMLVVIQDGELFEPLPGTPSTHIVKPEHPGEDYPASVINEYFTMQLAGRLGLEVPAVQRRYCPQPVYIVARFDRQLPAVSGDVDAVRRLHLVDTCQLLNKSRSFKYSAAHLATLAEAIAYCREKAATRLKLYRWLLFNMLLGNGDNHIKNISFLADASGIRLAPAYDLLSTAVYASRAMANERANWPATPLAFSVGDAETFADLKRGHLLDAAKALGLAEATAIRELDRMLKAAPLEADALIAEIEAAPAPEAAPEQLASERYLLRSIRHIVLADMCRQLAAEQGNP